jgi:hypothetical protein
MAEAGFVGRLVFFLGGLLVWAAHFTFLYGFHALVCARPGAGTTALGFSVVSMTIGVATVIAVGIIAAIGVTAMRGRGPGIRTETVPALREFWRYGTVVIAAFSLVAVIWSGIPALVVLPCG